eukprot:GHVR01128598.1.p1 GENE.GHVR01128598.1~~GHVR01128598.1.p1  ORF type:complete len:143 (-),score=22.04 GHVR01128598.1:581-1009(-)
MLPCVVRRILFSTGLVEIVSVMPFDAKAFIAYCDRVNNEVGFGQINATTKNDDKKTYIVEIGKDIFKMFTEEEAKKKKALLLLPNAKVELAKAAIETCWDALKIIKVAASAPLLVAGAAPPGLFGCAATTSGLARPITSIAH